MAISLSKLCIRAEKKYKLKLVAGKGGIENPVRWVHMVEDKEVPNFLHGGELIFTTGIAHNIDIWLINFVDSLKKKNASGLVVNIGPYISKIPPQVIVYCEQNDFPLFIVPWETRLIDMTYDFCRMIIADEKTEQSLSDTFKNLILNPANKDGYSTMLAKMGFRESSKYRVVTMGIYQNGKNITNKLISEMQVEFIKITKLNNLPRGAFVWDKCMILVYQHITESDIGQLVASVSDFVASKDGLKIHIGFSESIDGYSKLAKIYKKSKSALRIAKIKDIPSVAYEDIGIYKLLFEVESQSVLHDYYNVVMGDLVSYDKENNSDYCKTLLQYIENDGSVQKVAEINNSHRNTINYKMKKIKELLNTELDIKSTAEIVLAFKIYNIINT